MTLSVIVLPLGLAWLLLGWIERKRAPGAAPRRAGRRGPRDAGHSRDLRAYDDVNRTRVRPPC